MPETGTIREVYASPKTVEWTFSNFFLQRSRVGYLVASPKFYFRNHSCRLIVLPNGTDNLPEIMVVTVTGVGKSGTVKWELEIRRADDTVLRTCGGWKKDGSEVEMSMLIPSREIEVESYARGFVITCTLHNEDDINRASQQRKFKENGNQTESTLRTDKLSDDLEELFLTGDDSNVTIRVQDQEFKAHKSILGARSPVFASMFKHKMTENIIGELDVSDCDSNTFRVFLQYLYTGRVTKCSPNNAIDLYKVAHKYQVDELMGSSLEYIKNNLCVDMFCEAIILSDHYDEEELRDIAMTFLSENMTDIMDTEKWQTFWAENPAESNGLLLEALKLQRQNE